MVDAKYFFSMSSADKKNKQNISRVVLEWHDMKMRNKILPTAHDVLCSASPASTSDSPHRPLFSFSAHVVLLCYQTVYARTWKGYGSSSQITINT